MDVAIRERSRLLNPQADRDISEAWKPKKKTPSDVRCLTTAKETKKVESVRELREHDKSAKRYRYRHN